MKTNKMKMMSTLYILTAFLGLHMNTLFAAGSSSELPVKENETLTRIAVGMIAPSTPAEATFGDIAETGNTDVSIADLSPVVPMMADFSDGAPTAEVSTIMLAPATPKEAEFEEVSEEQAPVSGLAPETPANAEFEESI